MPVSRAENNNSALIGPFSQTVSSTVRFLVEFQSNVLKQLVLSDQNAVGDKVQV